MTNRIEVELINFKVEVRDVRLLMPLLKKKI